MKTFQFAVSYSIEPGIGFYQLRTRFVDLLKWVIWTFLLLRGGEVSIG